MNTYSYVPEPLGWVDPWGLSCTPNVVRGKQGQPLSASATIGKSDLGTGTGTNAISRSWARLMGKNTDDAGHILGKVLGGQGGKGNVFPQLSGINRGEYRVFEKSVRDFITRSGTADLKWTFKYGNGGTRPTEIIYEVFQNDQKVLSGIFGN